MRPALDLLTEYASHHRDRRNIMSHFIGVPMIVYAVAAMLSRPEFMFNGWVLTPAWLLFGAAAAWYLTRGYPVLGLAVSAALAVLVALGQRTGQGGTAAWLGWGVGCFTFGWLIQTVGHWYEGKKPVFVEDPRALLVAPMFVTAEALFALGWGKRLLAQIEQRVGPTVLRDLARIA
jgi:uncharacterized membrane protein YGL010W